MKYQSIATLAAAIFFAGAAMATAAPVSFVIGGLTFSSSFPAPNPDGSLVIEGQTFDTTKPFDFVFTLDDAVTGVLGSPPAPGLPIDTAFYNNAILSTQFVQGSSTLDLPILADATLSFFSGSTIDTLSLLANFTIGGQIEAQISSSAGLFGVPSTDQSELALFLGRSDLSGSASGPSQSGSSISTVGGPATSSGPITFTAVAPRAAACQCLAYARGVWS
ncbi:MAG: hypothetical protein AAGH38_10185 [Pseudomonadota bacterium]